jgi:hypothetical protein
VGCGDHFGIVTGDPIAADDGAELGEGEGHTAGTAALERERAGAAESSGRVGETAELSAEGGGAAGLAVGGEGIAKAFGIDHAGPPGITRTNEKSPQLAGFLLFPI